MDLSELKLIIDSFYSSSLMDLERLITTVVYMYTFLSCRRVDL